MLFQNISKSKNYPCWPWSPISSHNTKLGHATFCWFCDAGSHLAFIEDKSIEKSSFALHGHGSTPDDPTIIFKISLPTAGSLSLHFHAWATRARSGAPHFQARATRARSVAPTLSRSRAWGTRARSGVHRDRFFSSPCHGASGLATGHSANQTRPTFRSGDSHFHARAPLAGSGAQHFYALENSPSSLRSPAFSRSSSNQSPLIFHFATAHTFTYHFWGWGGGGGGCRPLHKLVNFDRSHLQSKLLVGKFMRSSGLSLCCSVALGSTVPADSDVCCYPYSPPLWVGKSLEACWHICWSTRWYISACVSGFSTGNEYGTVYGNSVIETWKHGYMQWEALDDVNQQFCNVLSCLNS